MITVGTIIHGTLRPQDLIPCFLSELDIEGNRRFATEWNSITSFMEKTGAWTNAEEDTETIDEDWFDTEPAMQVLEDLFDALDAMAQEKGMYFGAHEGDGSDFGYWKIEEEAIIHLVNLYAAE